MDQTAHQTTGRFKNPYRISVTRWREREGFESEDEFMEWLGRTSISDVAPAMCLYCGDVEPDGHCEHGCPSILIAMGMI